MFRPSHTLFFLLLSIALGGCGYVGPVLPPSPQIPSQVTDLAAVERGGKIVISFRTPPRTTDNVAIRHFSDIDLRVGAALAPFDFDRWADTAKPYPLKPPAPGDRDDPQPIAMSEEIPVAAWLGQHVAIAVRTSVRNGDHYSSWSNRVVLDVIPPLTPPGAPHSESAADGVILTWRGTDGADGYRVQRLAPSDKLPVEIGTSDKPSYRDSTAQYDAKYSYTITAFRGTVESLPSDAVEITPVDTFPPSVPGGLTVLPGPDSIEVSWQRSPEADLKGYYIYRSVDGAAFEKQGDLLTLPTYSDTKVERGKTYRYEVSAVDKKDNESAKTAPAQTVF